VAGPNASGMRVVVGVTGGIACYKAVAVVRELTLLGHDVHVIPTHSALQFVGAATWEAISQNPVSADVFTGVDQVRHVALGQTADLVIVSPATAHFLAQYATGLAADLLGTTLLATTAPVVLAPAMHTEMWEHQATTANLTTLKARGVHIVGPASGRLTGSDSGPGRMVEPDEIVRFALGLVGPKPLAGKKVVISGGGTREAIDPVRFLGNRSTGLMATSLAKAALSRGASVTLVHAPLDVPVPPGVYALAAESADEMCNQMVAASVDADIVIMAAAVADWSLAEPFSEKVSKTSDDTWTVTFHKTPDIAKILGENKPAGQVLVGFAAETVADDDDLLARAKQKLEAKNCDVVVANRVGNKLGFGEADTAVWFVQRSGAPVLSTGSKLTVAGHLFDVLLAT
jgi:phosphopantothenoylcysteine decarboxylase/phosphopantothenate--cysteine ligase